MSYTAANIPVLEGETGYQLDDGTYVACKVTAAAQGSSNESRHALCFNATVRAVNQDGSAREWADGHPIVARHTFEIDGKDVGPYGGQQACAVIALKLALGEPDAIADLNDDIRALLQSAAHDGVAITL